MRQPSAGNSNGLNNRSGSGREAIGRGIPRISTGCNEPRSLGNERCCLLQVPVGNLLVAANDNGLGIAFSISVIPALHSSQPSPALPTT